MSRAVGKASTGEQQTRSGHALVSRRLLILSRGIRIGLELVRHTEPVSAAGLGRLIGMDASQTRRGLVQLSRYGWCHRAERAWLPSRQLIRVLAAMADDSPDRILPALGGNIDADEPAALDGIGEQLEDSTD